MRFADINKRYTEIVAEWLAKGYTINASTMSGSQGETAKIDLTDGSAIIRIYVDSYHSWEDVTLDGVGIYVGLSIDNVKPNTTRGDTIWMNRLDVIHKEMFYKVGEDRWNGTYYGTREEAEKAQRLRIDRFAIRDHFQSSIKRLTDPRALAIAQKIIQKKMGFKRVAAKDVTLTRQGSKYIVGYRGKGYCLK